MSADDTDTDWVIKVSGGKYSVLIDRQTHKMKFHRYGELWSEEESHDIKYGNMIRSLALELWQAREAMKKLADKEWRDGIRITYVYPPIPQRKFDWSCVSKDYEPPMTQGWGRTEIEAIIDYAEQEVEKEN